MSVCLQVGALAIGNFSSSSRPSQTSKTFQLFYDVQKESPCPDPKLILTYAANIFIPVLCLRPIIFMFTVLV